MVDIKSSEITPEHVYLSRRRFMKGVGAFVAGSLLLAACGGQDPTGGPLPTATPSGTAGGSPTAAPNATAAPATGATPARVMTDELGRVLTEYEAVTNYCNYYEFSTRKDGVAKLAESFRSSPWTVEVGGLVSKPGIYDLDDLAHFESEERIYRLRCVEAWSMVIPWNGFPLSTLLKEVEPTSQAKYVRFETLYDPEQMPGLDSPYYNWPYVEGLRLDEAMNDLTLLATGLYGKPLPPQNGAPVRLVVPWKYGFKSIKSIVKIDLVDEMPVSLWMAAAPNEYGFYANVNPAVDHPRWSQATERRIGESGRAKTMFLNGYEEEVAHLYQGMDLTQWY